MARIRTVKPDFWTDEKLTECSMSARLFFIGTWNFADDNGNLARSAKKLKMQIFPAESLDCEPLIQELLTIGVLIEYEVEGEKYLHIKGFAKHQVINRPSKSSIPQPPISEEKKQSGEGSLNTHGGLTDGKEGNGKEGNGNNSVPNGTGASAPPDGLTAKDAIFSIGVPWLVNNLGKDKEGNIRSLLGGAVKQLGEEGAWEITRHCMDEKPVEPIAWIAAALNAKLKTTKKQGAKGPAADNFSALNYGKAGKL